MRKNLRTTRVCCVVLQGLEKHLLWCRRWRCCMNMFYFYFFAPLLFTTPLFSRGTRRFERPTHLSPATHLAFGMADWIMAKHFRTAPTVVRQTQSNILFMGLMSQCFEGRKSGTVILKKSQTRRIFMWKSNLLFFRPKGFRCTVRPQGRVWK